MCGQMDRYLHVEGNMHIFMFCCECAKNRLVIHCGVGMFGFMVNLLLIKFPLRPTLQCTSLWKFLNASTQILLNIYDVAEHMYSA